jgi:8-amino-7-oxononanoate synthase
MPQILYKNFLDNNLYPRFLKNISLTDDATSAHIHYQGRDLINFSSNDYLGLARHPLLITRSQDYAKKWGVGAASSRLVAGNFSAYETLEQQLAIALGKPSVLLLGAGYQANISVIEALLDPRILGARARVFSDRYCHVSLLTMTQHLSDLHRFRHQDYDHLENLLEKYRHSSQPKFIIIESIYSMDGDKTDLKKITSLSKKYNAFLYVDDAHSVGLYGPDGWGEAVKYADDCDIIMGTFSKGLGSFGAYIACSQVIKDYLINTCRGLIYSTGLSPAILGAIAGAIELLPQLENTRQAVIKKSDDVRDYFKELQLDCGLSNTHIIPWIIGDAEKTVYASALLEEEGILAPAIRPPSVPVSGSRIRFCLSALHSEEDIMQLKEAVKKVRARL